MSIQFHEDTDVFQLIAQPLSHLGAHEGDRYQERLIVLTSLKSAMSSPIADGKRKRAQKACQFCHQRKMKCNNVLPTCANCVTHGQQCTYSHEPKRPRPSNDRISRLEEENRQLQARIVGSTTSSDRGAQERGGRTRLSIATDPVEQSAPRIPHSSSVGDGRAGQGDLVLNPVATGLAENAEFHGPSSVLFIEESLNARKREDLDAQNTLAEPVSSGLMANAATQRTFHRCPWISGPLPMNR